MSSLHKRHDHSCELCIVLEELATQGRVSSDGTSSVRTRDATTSLFVGPFVRELGCDEESDTVKPGLVVDASGSQLIGDEHYVTTGEITIPVDVRRVGQDGQRL